MAIRIGTLRDDELFGTPGSDFLFGLTGNDTLTGFAGRDRLFGGRGNDTYIVDPFDRVLELPRGGMDTVVADFSYTLGAGLENLVLAGTADIDGTGNGLDNLIVGNAGSNVLSGGDGNDTLDGGLGGDVFGIDVVLGAAGDDRLVFDPDDVNSPEATGVRYHGGPGTDAIVFGETDQSLNLAATSIEAIREVEVFDLSGAGNHSLLFNVQSILLMSPDTQTIQVEGGAGDWVGTTPDVDWLFLGEVTIGEETYAEYRGGPALLRVDTDIDRGGIASPNAPGFMSPEATAALDFTALAGGGSPGAGAIPEAPGGLPVAAQDVLDTSAGIELPATSRAPDLATFPSIDLGAGSTQFVSGSSTLLVEPDATAPVPG